MTHVIDLRTDALTQPTAEMFRAMETAEFGWSDAENESVTELEKLSAGLLGMESALLVPTCSMANLLALMTLVERGEQVIFEESAHMITLEEWGVAYIVGAFPRLLKGERGQLRPESIREAVKAGRALDLPRTSLVCIENSHNNAGGTVLGRDETKELTSEAASLGARVHLDGARIWNAAVALGVAPSELTEGVTTVSASLNKGLAAPWGAVLCGPISVIEQARRLARRLGAASVHKQGMFAAAAIIGIKTMMTQLDEDNQRASELARGLSGVAGLSIDMTTVQSNIVLIDTKPAGLPASVLIEQLAQHNVLAKARAGEFQVRFVTHRHVSSDDIAVVVNAVEDTIRLYDPSTMLQR